jgi:hypothetical protein
LPRALPRNVEIRVVSGVNGLRRTDRKHAGIWGKLQDLRGEKVGGPNGIRTRE